MTIQNSIPFTEMVNRTEEMGAGRGQTEEIGKDILLGWRPEMPSTQNIEEKQDTSAERNSKQKNRKEIVEENKVQTLVQKALKKYSKITLLFNDGTEPERKMTMNTVELKDLVFHD